MKIEFLISFLIFFKYCVVLMWKIVVLAEALILYIYIYIYNDSLPPILANACKADFPPCISLV